MKNPSGKKLEKLVFRMFDQMIEGADKYTTKQGSTWLIFTEDKRWVVEFTKDKTLWFNYNLFQSELELIGKDCTEEKDFIKNWFESRFLNKPKVKHTNHLTIEDSWEVEDTIQNGVRHTLGGQNYVRSRVEGTIQNGVKHTKVASFLHPQVVEGTIQNGVKHTMDFPLVPRAVIEDTIQNGVRHTRTHLHPNRFIIEDTIQNGVKRVINPIRSMKFFVKDVIENGIKFVNDTDKLDSKIKTNEGIKNSVKDTSPLRGRFSYTIQDAIQNGVKCSPEPNQNLIEEVIKNDVHYIKHSYDFEEIVVDDIISDSI